MNYYLMETSETTPNGSNTAFATTRMRNDNDNGTSHQDDDRATNNHTTNNDDDGDNGTGTGVPSMTSLLNRLAMLHRLQDEMMNHRKIGMNRLRNKKMASSQQAEALKQYYFKQQENIQALQEKLKEQEKREQEREQRLRRLQEEQERIEQNQVRLLEQQLQLIVEEGEESDDNDHDRESGEQQAIMMEEQEERKGQERKEQHQNTIPTKLSATLLEILWEPSLDEIRPSNFRESNNTTTNDTSANDSNNKTKNKNQMEYYVGPNTNKNSGTLQDLQLVKIPVFHNKNDNSSNLRGSSINTNSPDETIEKNLPDSSKNNDDSSSTGGSSQSDLPMGKLRISQNTNPRASPDDNNNGMDGIASRTTTSIGNSPKELPVVRLPIKNKNRPPVSSTSNNSDKDVNNDVIPIIQRDTSSGSNGGPNELPIVKLRISNNTKAPVGSSSNNKDELHPKSQGDGNSSTGSLVDNQHAGDGQTTSLPLVKLPGSNKRRPSNKNNTNTDEGNPKRQGGRSVNSTGSQNNLPLVKLPASNKLRGSTNTKNSGTNEIRPQKSDTQQDLPLVKLPGTFLRVRVVNTPTSSDNNNNTKNKKKINDEDQIDLQRSSGGGVKQGLPIVKLPNRVRTVTNDKEKPTSGNRVHGKEEDISEPSDDKAPPATNPYLAFVKPHITYKPPEPTTTNNNANNDANNNNFDDEVCSDSSGDSSARGSQHDHPAAMRLPMKNNSNNVRAAGNDESGGSEENSDDSSLHELPFLSGLSPPVVATTSSTELPVLHPRALYNKTRSTASIIERNTSILRRVFEVAVTDNPLVPDAEDVTVASFTHAFMHHGGEDDYQDDFSSVEDNDDYDNHKVNHDGKGDDGETMESPVLCDILEHETPMTDPYGDMGQYTGSILRSTGMPHGFGRMAYTADGRTYEGHWRYGRWHGTGMAIFPNGDSYTGEYRSDSRHGQGKYSWSDGRVYDGAFRDDKRHGHGTFFFPDGSKYEGNFYKGLRQGHGTHKFANGGYYTGSWVNGRYEGRGEFRWADGSTYKGEWKAGMAHGMGIETYPDGRVRYQGRWIEDEPASKGFDSSRNGQDTATAVIRPEQANIRKVSVATDNRDDLWA